MFWAATLLKKAGIPDDTIAQIIGEAGPVTVPTPATPPAPPPNRAVENPTPGTFLRGPQSPVAASNIDITGGQGGQPQINVSENYPGTGGTPPPQGPIGRGPRPAGVNDQQAQIQALAAQLKSLGLSDQEIAKRIATLTDPVGSGTTALQPQGGPGLLQNLAQQFGDMWKGGDAQPVPGDRRPAEAPWEMAMHGADPAAMPSGQPEPDGRRLLMQAMFGANPRALPPQDFPVPTPGQTPAAQAPYLQDNAAAAGAIANGTGVPYKPGSEGGPVTITSPATSGPGKAGPGPTTMTPGYNTTPSPDQLSPTQLASVRPAAAQPGRLDVTKTTPTNDWGWEDLLSSSLRLMAAAEPEPGATRGPSLAGAIGKAGAATMDAKTKQRQFAAETGLKTRGLDIEQQNVQETAKLRQQLQEYDRTDKEIQRRLQGMTVNTQAYTAISGIRDGYAKELDKLQTSLAYLDALGKDPAAAAQMVKDLQDKRDADIAQVQQGIGASAGTASPTQSAPSKGPGPNAGTGPMKVGRTRDGGYAQQQADGSWIRAPGP